MSTSVPAWVVRVQQRLCLGLILNHTGRRARLGIQRRAFLASTLILPCLCDVYPFRGINLDVSYLVSFGAG